MDIDEASQTAACADQTNQNEQDTLGKSPLKRTLVVNYMGSPANGITSAYPTSIFNQSVEGRAEYSAPAESHSASSRGLRFSQSR
jgi:hypothetical protein